MKGIDYLREVWNVPYARDLVLVFHKAMQGIPIAPIEAIIAAKTSEKERINV